MRVKKYSYVAESSRSIKKPLLVGASAFSIYLVYIIVRVMVAGHSNPGSLIVLGHLFVNPKTLPLKGLPIINRNGYDGQFYFRLAMDPFDLNMKALGITFDTPYRTSRIGYPLLSYLLAFGQIALVPISLLATNLIAIFVLGTASGYLAQLCKADAWWGLLGPFYFGFALSTGRDLTEVSGSAMVIVALVLIRRERFGYAAAILAYAVITRETAVLIAGGLGLYWLWSNRHLFSRGRPRNDSPYPWFLWLIPSITYFAWQIVTYENVHQVSLKSDISSNLFVPLAAPVESLASHLSTLGSLASLLWLGQSAVWGIALLITAALLRSSNAKPWEKLTWAIAAIFSLSLSSAIWANDNYLRSVSLVWILALPILFESKPARKFVGSITAIAWVVSVLPLLLAI